jgi:hypothetical protein
MTNTDKEDIDPQAAACPRERRLRRLGMPEPATDNKQPRVDLIHDPNTELLRGTA